MIAYNTFEEDIAKLVFIIPEFEIIKTEEAPTNKIANR